MILDGDRISTANLRTLSEVQTLKEEALNVAKVSQAFHGLRITGDGLTIHAPGGATQVPQNWLGHVASESHSEIYVRKRHKLSEAAYWGDLKGVFEMLKYGKTEFNENWANAPRLSMMGCRRRKQLLC